jgi:predicted DNA-binding transcriptional regulator AlpA
VSRLLTPRQAAARLGVVPLTLANWRSRGLGPPFVKIGGYFVRYREEDLDAYVAARRVASTAEAHRLVDRGSGAQSGPFAEGRREP